jgi:hypothetical protein
MGKEDLFCKLSYSWSYTIFFRTHGHYKVLKEDKINRQIPKARLLISPPAKFNLTSEDEINIIMYVTKLPFTSSGLSASHVADTCGAL